MSEKKTKIEITERETGFTIEVTGKALNDFCRCGCSPLAFAAGGANDCCDSEEKK